MRSLTVKFKIMIQRIQTLYLLLVVILSGIVLFSAFAGLVNTTDALNYIVNYKGVFLVQANGNQFLQNVWGVTALAAIIPLVALATIFLYKKRSLQIKLSFFNIVLMVAYYGVLFFYLWQFGSVYHADWFLEVVTAFPLVNVILSALAIRSIRKDEALIKSLNRLR